MTFKNIKLPVLLLLFSGFTASQAQTTNTSQPDTIIVVPSKIVTNIVDNGIRSEQSWRNTGATFSITGDELAKTNAGNLLNTLQARIPGLTVATGSGSRVMTIQLYTYVDKAVGTWPVMPSPFTWMGSR